VLGIINGVNVHDLSSIGLKVFPVVILGGLDSNRRRDYRRDYNRASGNILLAVTCRHRCATLFLILF